MMRVTLLGLVLLAFAGLASADTQDNLARCQKFYTEVANKGNMAVVDELVAENFVDHEVFPGLAPTRDGLKEFFNVMRSAFPDLKFNVEFMMADGDKVAAYITMSGTHKGEFMGMPASGKKFTTKAIDIVRIVDGKAVEHWGVTDGMTMMQQLGALPEEPPAKN